MNLFSQEKRNTKLALSHLFAYDTPYGLLYWRISVYILSIGFTFTDFCHFLEQNTIEHKFMSFVIRIETRAYAIILFLGKGQPDTLTIIFIILNVITRTYDGSNAQRKNMFYMWKNFFLDFNLYTNKDNMGEFYDDEEYI